MMAQAPNFDGGNAFGAAYAAQFNGDYNHGDQGHFGGDDAPRAAPHHPQQYAGAPHHSACFVCHVQRVPSVGMACSRRCDWVAHGCCPQCGRYSGHGGVVFCSPMCATQARQANWCIGCGVRQLAHGQSSCANAECTIAVQRLAARLSAHVRTAPNANHSQPARAPAMSGGRNGGATRGRGKVEAHSILAASDKTMAVVRQQVGQALSSSIQQTIKVGGSLDDRKQYTAYRCRAESELNEACGIGAPKYGHGGEGNEQRRVVPLRWECVGSTTPLRHCGSATCQLCALLDGGVRSAFRQVDTTPAFNSATHALSTSTSPAATALLLARVTVGNPSVTSVPDEADAVVPQPAPDASALIHSAVLKHAAFDVAHVPVSAVAVDPLFVVLPKQDSRQ